MEELLELRQCIEEQRYDDAMFIINELDAMSKDDKIRIIRSYIKILLVHCIKQFAEQATTRSWERSIRNSVEEIIDTNTRHSSSGTYLREDEVRNLVESRFHSALADAADEAFGGMYTSEQLAAMIDAEAVKERAMTLITGGYVPSNFPFKQ